MDESNARAAVIEKVEGWLDLFDDDMKPKSTDTPIPPQVLELLAKFEEDRSSSTTTTSSTSSTSSYPFSLDDTLFQFPSNSGSEEADVWFRRGIAWAHGFNFEEGSRCFQQALNIQDFSLGHWGLALCQGPYYNRHGARYVKEGQRRDAPTFNIMRALEHAMEAERRLSTLPSDSIQSKLVRAMCVRCRSFATTLVVEEEEEEEKEKEKEQEQEQQSVQVRTRQQFQDLFEKCEREYADQLRIVFQAHPDDPNVAAMFASSLMNLAPWRLWCVFDCYFLFGVLFCFKRNF